MNVSSNLVGREVFKVYLLNRSYVQLRALSQVSSGMGPRALDELSLSATITAERHMQ